jgi:FdhD protein
VSDGFRRVEVWRVGREIAGAEQDSVAVEEPLEVRLHGKAFATIMRTPGADKDLAAGFLLSEGVIASAGDVGAIEHCRHPQHPEFHNIVDVFLAGGARRGLERHLEARRNVVANSSCGICGRLTIESLQHDRRPVSAAWTIDAGAAASLPSRLRSRQRLFDATGGLHAAGLFAAAGDVLAFGEDVGRHNAVDKAIGRMVMDDRLPLADMVLAVSGRASFEIVQKAWMAGVPLICAVSAPSSLAIDLADAAGITLLAFARERGFNIYTHRSRVRQV